MENFTRVESMLTRKRGASYSATMDALNPFPSPVPMLVLALSAALAAPSNAQLTPVLEPVPALVAPVSVDDVAEYKKKREEAGKDVAKLWKLVDWCESRGMKKERKSCLRAIVKAEPDDEKARELLGHVFYDGKWFTTAKKLEKYKKDAAKRKAKEEEKLAKEKGLVRFGDSWVDPKDLPYLEQGLVKDEFGDWIDPVAVKRLAEGWVQQDLVWVSPDEVANIDKGLWKCGEQWLSEADANAYHSDFHQWWVIPTDHFTLMTTCAREDAKKIALAVDDTYRDLVRIFGTNPVGKPHLLVLNSIDQYNVWAGGDEGLGINPTESTGWSSANSTFFADAWIDEERNFKGAGVTYWNAADENDVRFANHWVRHAAAQSFIEALDPSPEACSDLKTSSSPRMEDFVRDFWDEKVLPSWLRFGAATYVERYYLDRFADDKLWVRNWSVGNILNKGGLDPIGTILSFKIDLGSQEGADSAAKMFNEAGLLLAFALDGKNADVKKAHGAFKAAFKEFRAEGTDANRKACEKAARAFGDSLRSAEGDLRTWGGL